MSAAPSLAALFDTQAIFEAALSAYAAANGITSHTSRGANNMPDSRIECQFIPGAAQGHQATRTTSKTGWPEQDMFSGSIAWRVQTERAVDKVSPVHGFASTHDYRVALLKSLMLRGAVNGTIAGIAALVVPYHSIVVEGFTGQTPTIADDGMDVTEIGYAITYQIKADAWPTPAA